MPPRKTHRTLTVVGLLLALAMAALEATVIATAMPTVIGDLGGIDQYAWVATAYLLTSSVTVPIYGKLADMYGRKPILLFGIATFLIGSAASGASRSMAALIAFRALQGLGAGAMQPMAVTVVGDIFDVEERSRMQGLFGASWGFFGLVGPLLGGLIVEALSWRWVFYINIPFGVAAAALVITSLHEQVERRRRAIDVPGAILLAAGTGALLFAGHRAGGPGTWPAAGVALVLFAAFVAVERRAAEPVLPLALFARPVLLTSSVTGAIIGGAMIATMTYVPLFVQGVLRGSPTDASSSITPMVVGWPVAAALSGRLIPRVGFRPLIRAGLFVTASAGLGLALFAAEGTLNGLRLTTLLFGVGMGLSNTALVIAVQSSVEWHERGVATASTMFFRTLGGLLAVGALGGVINAALAEDPSLPIEDASRLLTPEGAQRLGPELVGRLGQALGEGLGTAFWIIAVMGVLGFVVALGFPRIPVGAKAKVEGGEPPG